MKLVLLPGLDGSGLLFSPLLAALGEHRESQIISLNDADGGDDAALVQHIHSQLPSHHSYLLVAESFSGRLAYDTGLAKPQGLCGIVFVATFLRNPNPALLRLRPILKTALSLHLHRLPGVSRALFPATNRQALSALLNRAIDAAGIKALDERLKSLRARRLPEQRLSLPSLYLQARHDQLVSRAHLSDFQRHCDQLEWQPISGTHFLLQTAPQACARAIQSFAEELSPFPADRAAPPETSAD